MQSSPASVSGNSGQTSETSVRQLIANGKFKTALENAKDFHKAQRTAASESLLLDAYAARIQSLLDQNLAVEAKSLLELVLERFPSARGRLDRFVAAVFASAGDLSVLLEPLNDPQLDPERRAAIEQIILQQVTDLAALASCAALPLEHSLRRAASALDRAFNLVTSGPVADEQIALPEVSYRSPLSSWKLLIRSIASLHRGDDAACRESLAAIKPDSVPYRLVPAMEAMLGVETGAKLKPAAAALVSRVSVGLAELRSALTRLDRVFDEREDDGRIFKAVRAAVNECRRSAPDVLEELQQIVAARGELESLDDGALREALGGLPRQNAAFLRMAALAAETSGNEEDDLLQACELWDGFRRQAVKEGWFRANGVEVAILYLHMADLLERVPEELLEESQQASGPAKGQAAGEERYFLFPEKLYARACAIDPDRESFAQWMRWASEQSVSQGEDVGREWNRIRPDDIEPVLYLMEQAEKRAAFPAALSYVEKAERIDAINPEVRAARLRLLIAGAISDLQKKKPQLAAEKLAAMESLPQSQQGDRPAFLAVLRQLIRHASGDESGAAAARLEAERLLGGRVAAAILGFGIASLAKRLDSVFLLPPKSLGKQERKALPASLARVLALIRDVGIKKLELPVPYLAETEQQFPKVKESLSLEEIFLLGDMGVFTERPKLAWAASGEGLRRGGTFEARFMLLRARATPEGHGGRFLALGAAAIELGRFHRDKDVIDAAVEMVRNPFGGDSISLTLDQARDVIRKELSSPAFPGRYSPGPDYAKLLPAGGKPCQCPNCRRRRGEAALDPFDEGAEDDEYDEAELEKLFEEAVPEGLSRDVEARLFELMKESLLTGESPDEIMSRLYGGNGKKKKGRRK